ncbi:MAG: hypothetical protein KJZ87_10495, partial [Thermoguttaceae bacterium]|nr:hypothetical protein [Thermoguttaceae bacterium]
MLNWYRNLGLKVKLLSILLVIGVLFAGGYAWHIYRQSVSSAVEQARADANYMIEHSAQMFM